MSQEKNTSALLTCIANGRPVQQGEKEEEGERRDGQLTEEEKEKEPREKNINRNIYEPMEVDWMHEPTLSASLKGRGGIFFHGL